MYEEDECPKFEEDDSHLDEFCEDLD